MAPKQAQDIMTPQPATCTPDTYLYDVARLMVENDCGAIPVVAGLGPRKPIGVITDRDIACRGMANAVDPLVIRASDVMSSNPITVKANADLHDCIKLMESNGIRRLLVVDDQGICVGIISHADLALKGLDQDALELLKQVSQPPGTPSRFARAA